MAYTLQDEESRDTINHESLLKILGRGIDDMETGRELPLTEAFFPCAAGKHESEYFQSAALHVRVLL